MEINTVTLSLTQYNILKENNERLIREVEELRRENNKLKIVEQALLTLEETMKRDKAIRFIKSLYGGITFKNNVYKFDYDSNQKDYLEYLLDNNISYPVGQKYLEVVYKEKHPERNESDEE